MTQFITIVIAVATIFIIIAVMNRKEDEEEKKKPLEEEDEEEKPLVEEEKKPLNFYITKRGRQQEANEKRFSDVAGITIYYGYQLVLTEAPEYCDYVKYDVYKDDVLIGWSNSRAKTSEELKHEILEKCNGSFQRMAKRIKSRAKLDEQLAAKKKEYEEKLEQSLTTK